jgi:hypothetical protein
MAKNNIRRYFAALACEQGDWKSAIALAFSAFARAPGPAITDMRNWMVLAAAAGGMLPPRNLFEKAMPWSRRYFCGRDNPAPGTIRT